MKHIAAYILAGVLVAFAGVVVWFNRADLKGMPLYVSFGALLFAVALAAAADAKTAVEVGAGAWSAFKNPGGTA